MKVRGGATATRAAIVAVVGCTLASSCTTGSTTPAPSSPLATSPAPRVASVRTTSTTFDVLCEPVAEALVDIELDVPSGPRVRAITGVAVIQALGVYGRDPTGCGEWQLAIARGLSPDVMQAIVEEVRRGVERFGVTASPVPREEPEVG